MLIALLAVNLETSDKVTGQPWHLAVFKCTSEHSCYPKSFIFSWNQPVTLLTCTEVSFLRLATRGKQRPAFGIHSLLMPWPKIMFAFYHQMPWQRQFSFSPKQRDWTTTGQRCHHFVPLPSATFQATSLFHHPTACSLSDQRTIPSVFCSLAGNGNFSPIREIHIDQTKGSCKATSSGEYHTWILTAQPGWNSLPLVTKEKRVRSCLILKLPRVL